MLDPIALLQSLTLPAGATTGARIELDGVTGEIRVFDSSGNLRERIRGNNAAYELFSGIAQENLGGQLQESAIGIAGTTRRFSLDTRTGNFLGRNRAIISMVSQSENGGLGTVITLQADTIDFIGSSGQSPILTAAGSPLPRGIVAQQKVVANQAGITIVTDLTGLSITFTADPTHTYRVKGHCLAESNTVGDIFILSLTDGANTLLKQDRTERLELTGVGASVDVERVFGPLTSDALSGLTTVKLRGQRNAGASTCQMDAGTTNPAYIYVEDIS